MNVELFEDALKESGMRTKFLSDKLGISAQAFNKKRKGTTPFTLEEVKILREPLKLTLKDIGNIFLE